MNSDEMQIVDVRGQVRWVARLVSLVLALALLSAACGGSAGSGATGEPAANRTEAENSIDEGSGSETRPSNESADSSASSGPAVATTQLGFTADSFEVTMPEDAFVVDGTPVISDAEQLLDAGVDDGTWTEVVGVRAIVSVVLGELAPEAIPQMNDLPHPSHGDILDRARILLDDPNTPEDQRADLARLTAFFFADLPPRIGDGSGGDGSGEDEGAFSLLGSVATGALQPIRLDGDRRTCALDEFVLFRAPDSPVCYEVYESEEDLTIYVPDTSVEAADLIADTLTAQVATARARYDELAGSTFEDVHILVSAVNSSDRSMGHAMTATKGSCRVALFADEEAITSVSDMRFVLAHELFHCVQREWTPSREEPTKFVEEAGADYFAYALTGLCPEFQIALGTKLDKHTATGSLLTASYEGWYFWAYLAEHGHLTTQNIAAAHRLAYEGTPIEDALPPLTGDLASILNEFYVRMMGPGLACDFQGSEYTGAQSISAVGPVVMKSSMWQGTRYLLTYAERMAFAQTDLGTGHIGMAEERARGNEGDWVTHAPSVRTTCTEATPWIAVVTAPSDGDSEQALEVTQADTAACDPCVLGLWSIDMGSMTEFFQTIMGEGSMSASGVWTVEFLKSEDGSAALREQSDAVFEFLVGSGIFTKVNGDHTGGYTAQESQLAIFNYGGSNTAGFQGIVAVATTAGEGAQVEYVCEGNILRVSMDGAQFWANRSPALPEGTPYF